MRAVYTTVGGEVLSETRGGVERDYVPDPLGSTRALSDASGTITDTWSYWPYGEERSRTGSSATPFAFVGTLGYWTDVPGDRVYVRARHYRPALARWQTLDPLWPSESPYAYVGGDPKTRVDPSGMADWVHGVGTCYDEDFKNCCTYCDTCFDPEAATGALLLKGKAQKWRCGDIVKCCLQANTSKCVTITDTGSGYGKSERLIDFACGYVKTQKFMNPVVGMIAIQCMKVGHTVPKKAPRCSSKPRNCCSDPNERGINCGGHLKNRFEQ